MKRWGLIAAVACAFTLPTGAAAHTTVLGPALYQQWVDASRVPTPDVAVEVVEDAAPCLGEYGQAVACVLGGRIYIEDMSTPVFYHELGHIFDANALTDGDRARFSQLVGIPLPWRYPFAEEHNGPSEYFAEAYYLCAQMGRRIASPILERPDESLVSVRRHFQICTLIRRAYWY